MIFKTQLIARKKKKEKRRQDLCLTFLYKMVEGMVPVIPPWNTSPHKSQGDKLDQDSKQQYISKPHPKSR